VGVSHASGDARPASRPRRIERQTLGANLGGSGSSSVPGVPSLWTPRDAGGVEPPGDRGRTHLVVLGETPDAGPGLVPASEVAGDVGATQQAVVLRSGCERGPAYAEGPGGGRDGAVTGEGGSHLVLVAFVAAVDVAVSWGGTPIRRSLACSPPVVMAAASARASSGSPAS